MAKKYFINDTNIKHIFLFHWQCVLIFLYITEQYIQTLSHSNKKALRGKVMTAFKIEYKIRFLQGSSKKSRS